MERTTLDEIISLIKREVVPAIGCTEPVAVALCVAKAAELLGKEPEHIEVRLSSNILKNAMGVGIPGTGTVSYTHLDVYKRQISMVSRMLASSIGLRR